MSEYLPVAIIILQLIFLEGILSIDNAAVIGALVWLAQGIGIVNEFVDWVFAPVRGLVRILFSIFKRIEPEPA